MAKDSFLGKRVLITGGTGSLGQALLLRLTAANVIPPREITVFSRNEGIQWEIGQRFPRVKFVIGDIRDRYAVNEVVKGKDIVIHAAALKHVPVGETQPEEVIKTNIRGTINLISACEEHHPDRVIGISTDKACNPCTLYGATKMILERLITNAALEKECHYTLVRYGNVLSSRGSVIPLFQKQIAMGGPVTVTDPNMTRFLLSLDEAINTIFYAIKKGNNGCIYVPRLLSARIGDLAKVLVGDKNVEIRHIGARPGEKMHEILISNDEKRLSLIKDWHYIIPPHGAISHPTVNEEYSSKDHIMGINDLALFLEKRGVI